MQYSRKTAELWGSSSTEYVMSSCNIFERIQNINSLHLIYLSILYTCGTEVCMLAVCVVSHEEATSL